MFFLFVVCKGPFVIFRVTLLHLDQPVLLMQLSVVHLLQLVLYKSQKSLCVISFNKLLCIHRTGFVKINFFRLKTICYGVQIVCRDVFHAYVL